MSHVQEILRVIVQKHRFLKERPVLAEYNRNGNLRPLIRTEAIELKDAYERFTDSNYAEHAVEFAEELPDILLYAIQYWLLSNTRHSTTAWHVYQARHEGNLLSEFNSVEELVELLVHTADQFQDCAKNEAECLRWLLSLTFAICCKHGWNLLELSDLKERFNNRRFRKRLYREGGPQHPIGYNRDKKVATRAKLKKKELYPAMASAISAGAGMRM